MSKEEAIKWFRENPFYHKDHVPFNMAIKALEQESILDKIRAEIKFEVDRRTNMLCAEDVFEIIDKYKEG